MAIRGGRGHHGAPSAFKLYSPSVIAEERKRRSNPLLLLPHWIASLPLAMTVLPILSIALTNNAGRVCATGDFGPSRQT